MYTIYGDDSADETTRRVFGVGTIYGSAEDWADLKSRWVDRNGGIPFHATDCDSDGGVYKDRPHAENKALYKDLVKMVCASNLLGVASVVNLKEFFEVFPDASLDNAYYSCFQDAVTASVTYAAACVPRAPIEIIFDNRIETAFNASQMYDSIAQRPEWKGLLYLPEKVSFMDRREVGVQVADLIAREAMKHYEGILFTGRAERLSWQALIGANRVTGHFFDREHFLAVRAGVEEIAKRTDGPYAAWLKARNRQDNPESRRTFTTLFGWWDQNDL